MNIETDLEHNQVFNVAATEDQLKIVSAKKMLVKVRQYVVTATMARDAFAYQDLAELDKLLKDL